MLEQDLQADENEDDAAGQLRAAFVALAQLSDLVFVVDGAKQTLAGSLPNLFFGHIILIFEELMARFFSPEPAEQ